MLASLGEKLVNERKFPGSASAYGRVRAVQDTHCSEDDWFAADAVKSVYFDTPGLAAYCEAANGDNIRIKVRIRWYGFPEELPMKVPVFIEVKQRLGTARRKMHEERTAPARNNGGAAGRG